MSIVDNWSQWVTDTEILPPRVGESLRVNAHIEPDDSAVIKMFDNDGALFCPEEDLIQDVDTITAGPGESVPVGCLERIEMPTDDRVTIVDPDAEKHEITTHWFDCSPEDEVALEDWR